jgi:hypothetical protein
MAATILYRARETTLENATGKGEEVWLPLADLAGATGWALKPQGLCLGEVCVPVPRERRAEWLDEGRGRFNLTAFARHLGQPVVGDEAHGVWAFGEATRGSAPLGDPLEAPDFALPDLDGRMHALSDHRGKKVLLFCWASW